MFVNWDTFLDALAEWFEQRALLTPQARWVVGVSGGPDSTLLLRSMIDVSARRGLDWKLHVAHLHHGLRGADADADAEFVARLAENAGLPFHEERLDIRARVEAEGGSTEEVARERRYEFLERTAFLTGSDLVAVGHHADDNAETVLHRICRGTGLRGLAGMTDIRAIQPGSRVKLVRPFLDMRRATLEQLCRQLKLEYRTDATNESPEFTRARIRHLVLPLLRDKINPNVSEAILRLAGQAQWLGTYLEDAAARTFDSLVISESPNHLVLNTTALLSKQRIIQAEVIRRAISLVVGREQDLGFAHIEAVLKLAGDRASGKEVHVAGNVVVRKTYERLEFLPRDAAEGAAPVEWTPVFVRCPGRTPLPQMNAELVVDVLDVDPAKIALVSRGALRGEEWLDYERVRLPLQVRARREGDRFQPLGNPGTKSLSDFFIDEKVDPALRARIGVLCDQDGPIWVMPLRIDERVKLRPATTRALRLALQPLSGGGAAGA
jgi:tRNA(Ile)-lysidine synthase